MINQYSLFQNNDMRKRSQIENKLIVQKRNNDNNKIYT